MAWYKYIKFLSVNDHKNFDATYKPGEKAHDAGIYRCTGCGHEIGIADDHTMPPQGKHQHGPGDGEIRWQMIVCAIHKK